MALLCRRVMIFSLSVAVMGCASIRVEHLTEETFVPRRTISQIEWLNQEPVGPYDPAFGARYEPGGDFPEVAVAIKHLYTRILIAFGLGLAPIL